MVHRVIVMRSILLASRFRYLSNDSSIGKDSIESLMLKNKHLENEVAHLRQVLDSRHGLDAVRKEDPEIAGLLENNKKWVAAQLVS
jgi:hypothetical protein